MDGWVVVVVIRSVVVERAEVARGGGAGYRTLTLTHPFARSHSIGEVQSNER